MELPDAFDTFYDRISLGTKPHQRIESAAGGLIDYLSGAYSITKASVFLQGSYPNGTAIEPEDSDEGEYDVDLVCEFADPAMTPDQALDDLEAKLAADERYTDQVRGEDSRKTPCVRLFYAKDEVGAFHVDVVPARPSQSSDSQAKLEVPRRGEAWHDTAPREYTEWCGERGERFARTVQMLKRWREHHQDARKSIKSIVLQVLASIHLVTHDSDGRALVETLEAIKAALAHSPDTAPEVRNPVLNAENLAVRWDDPSYRDFGKELDEAVELARRALDSRDSEESHELWRELLGDDFPKYNGGGGQNRKRFVPAVPPPGHHTNRTAPNRERYG